MHVDLVDLAAIREVENAVDRGPDANREAGGGQQLRADAGLGHARALTGALAFERGASLLDANRRGNIIRALEQDDAAAVGRKCVQCGLDLGLVVGPGAKVVGLGLRVGGRVAGRHREGDAPRVVAEHRPQWRGES